MMRRIAFAGFQHETNTFAPGEAGRREFQMTDSWPGLLLNDAVTAGTHGLNLPIAGAIAAAKEMGNIDAVPILWCAAEPCGTVTDDAFDWITEQILNGLQKAGPVDGLYLDLHGAMVTQSHDDGEGELLARIRAVVGPDLPIGVSLDLHANISPAMVRAATLITVYRTYPHLDMAETGARCIRRLLNTLDGSRPAAAFRQAQFLVPLHAQTTSAEPAMGLYRQIELLDDGGGVFAELALGFTASDVHDCGPSVLAYADTTTEADALADKVMDALNAAEGQFDTTLLSAEEAVAAAMSFKTDQAAVIADVQDNPGAGGTSDTTGLLRELINAGAQNALVGIMHDPAFAMYAHRVGVGAVFDARLGGRSGIPGGCPVEGSFKVEALSDGQIQYAGEMYGGGTADIGLSCLVALVDTRADIRILVSSKRVQCLDRAFFTEFGVDPSRASIVCVKSTAHFRADFEPIAGKILNAAAPGAFACRLDEVPFRYLRAGVRRTPIDECRCADLDMHDDEGLRL